MAFGQPVWCHKCNLRIAPYDLKTVFRKHDYHRHCFQRLQQESVGTQAQARAGNRSGTRS